MHKIFYLRSTFVIYRRFCRNLASTNVDNETFSSVLLISQVVMVQSLRPKGRAFESTCVLFVYLYSIRLSAFIIDVPRALSNNIWINLFQMVDA